MGYLSLQLPEKQKDSPGWGCSCFYTTSTWHIQWRSTIYATYRRFGDAYDVTSWAMAIGRKPLLCRPIAAILQLLEGCNQGPAGLDYRYTGGSGAQRSGFPFHRYICALKFPNQRKRLPVKINVSNFFQICAIWRKLPTDGFICLYFPLFIHDKGSITKNGIRTNKGCSDSFNLESMCKGSKVCWSVLFQ